MSYKTGDLLLGGFPGDSDSKESSCNAGDQVPALGQEDPLEKGMATHSSIPTPGKSHEQRSLASYSPWGFKELDMTEQLTQWGAKRTIFP